jgi:Arc/MetJ family transcription regulator
MTDNKYHAQMLRNMAADGDGYFSQHDKQRLIEAADALATQAARIAELEEEAAGFEKLRVSIINRGEKELLRLEDKFAAEHVRANAAEARIAELERQLADLKKEAVEATCALREVYQRWRDGYAFDEDSYADQELNDRAARAFRDKLEGRGMSETIEKNPERIWLQSYEDTQALDQDRLWCEDKVWPENPDDHEPTQYVRIDLFNSAISTAREEGYKAGLEEAAKAIELENANGLERQICCDGQMCGCRGSTVGEYAAHVVRALKEKP